MCKYDGNRLTCKQCKYYEKGKCKNIDHDLIQIRPHVTNGYDGAYGSTNICCHYVPAEYIKNSKYTDINDYLEWLKEEWYDTNTIYKKRGLERIQHLEYVTLRIPSKDIEISVPLYDWMMGTWKNGNKIKYKEVYKLIKRKGTDKYYKRELIDSCELGQFKWYEI